MLLAMAIQQFNDSLPMMLHRALDAIMPRFRSIFSDFNLTEQQWRVLRVLWELEEATVRQLAELTLIPAPSLVGILDRLQKNKLVSRSRSEQDRRKVFVRATSQGQDLERLIMPLVQSTYIELKQSVDEGIWHDMLLGLHAVSKINVTPTADNEAVTGVEATTSGDALGAMPVVTQQHDL